MAYVPRRLPATLSSTLFVLAVVPVTPAMADTADAAAAPAVTAATPVTAPATASRATPASAACAPTPAATGATPAAPGAAATPAPLLPVGTDVPLELAEAVDADRHNPGDVVCLRVAADVLVEGKVVVAAGTPVRGEVIHAAQQGWGGRPAELVLTPRFIETASGPVPVHAAFAMSGEDHSKGATFGMALGGVLGAALAAKAGSGTLVVPAGTRMVAQVTSGEPLPARAPTSTLLRLPDVNSPVIGKPAPGKGQVVMFHSTRFVGSGAGYLVRENNTDVGGVDSGTFMVFSVEPGVHVYEGGKVRDPVTFEVAAGEVYYLTGSTVSSYPFPIANLMPASAEAFAAVRSELVPGEPQSDQ